MNGNISLLTKLLAGKYYNRRRMNMAKDFDQHTYQEHTKEADSRNTATYRTASNLIDSARVNANDTWREEKREDWNSEDWQDMYRASLRCLLSDEPDHKVRKWFYSRGFHF